MMASSGSESPHRSAELVDSWIDRVRQLRADALPGGTLAHVDAESRRRAAASVQVGSSINLARPLVSAAGPPASKFQLTTRFDTHQRITHGFDKIDVPQHGIDQTHMDAWNHYGVDGTFFPDVLAGSTDNASIERWADGVVTRALLLDIPEVRGAAWVDASTPVTGAELEAALALTGAEFRPGDAALIYSGRDRFEAAGHMYRTIPESIAAGQPRAGLGSSAAEWIARQQISVVCWDFLDAVNETEPRGSVHLLIWAIGLGLVDNCDLGSARAALRAAGRYDAMLALAPLRIRGATASLVSPLLVW